MKTSFKQCTLFLLCLLLFTGTNFAQPHNIKIERYAPNNHIAFATVDANRKIEAVDHGIPWLNQLLGLDDQYSWQIIASERDKLGYIHYRLRQTYNSYPIAHTMYIVHTKDGFITSANGEYASNITTAGATPVLSEKEALKKALMAINANRYKWELPYAEQHIKQEQNNESASYFPKGKLMIAKNETSDTYELCYRFDIYADLPLSRNYVFIDASSGAVVRKDSRIAHIDVPATGQSRYSGVVNMVCDSTATTYRLREAGRGTGIETYNMQNGTNYGAAVDFTHPDTNWDSLAVNDTLAIDVHFGAEATYDYLLHVQGRSSIDDNGFTLLNYVHFDNNFGNAFWDGQRMTYGDGDANINALVSLDVCGHEIGHGLQQFTAGFTQSGEAGALGESFSDILGLLVESYTFPSRTSAEIYNTGDQPSNDPNGVRNYIDPSLTNHPTTYLGTNWDNSGMNLHGNGVVHDHWFYILAEGKSGVNDNSDTFNVAGIGRDKAGDIAYRSLTVYLTPNSNFADARFYAIQAARDLYGACSQEEIETTNAWYAVGVGDIYDPALNVDFDYTINVCANPVTVQFNNRSNGAATFTWDFGDGNTGSVAQPLHTYASDGTFTVKLVATGCATGAIDSLVLVDEIEIDNSINCDSTALPTSGSATVNGCHGWLYDSGGRSGDAEENADGLITITAPSNSKVTLKFTAFDYQFFGTVTVYDGPDKSSPVLATYDSRNQPTLNNELAITGNVFSLHENVSTPFPGFPIGSGFEAFYSCKTVLGVNTTSLTNPTVFPNPATGKLYVSGLSTDVEELLLLNYTGSVMHRFQVNEKSHNQPQELNLSSFPTGIYFLHWNSSGTINTKKIVLIND